MQLRALLTAFAVSTGAALATADAKAATTYTFTGASNGLSSFSLTENDISLTVSNFISLTNVSIIDNVGLCIAGVNNDFCENQTSLSFTFNKPVRLISYYTGWNDFDNTPIVSFTQGSKTSLQSSFPQDATTSFTNQFVAEAGIPIVAKLLSTSPGVDTLQILKLNVDDVPGPVPFAGAAMAFGWSRRLRDRNRSRRVSL